MTKLSDVSEQLLDVNTPQFREEDMYGYKKNMLAEKIKMRIN